MFYVGGDQPHKRDAPPVGLSTVDHSRSSARPNQIGEDQASLPSDVLR